MFNFKNEGIEIAKVVQGNKEKILYLNKDNAGIPSVNQLLIKGATGLTKPICQYCNKDFYQKSDLKRHQAKACKMKQFKEFVNKHMKDENEIGNELILEEGTLIPLPRTDRREILYIAGPQGSGKSYYASQYMKEYKKKFPDNDIILFSRIEEDDSFKDIDEIMQIKLDNNLLNDPINAKKELINSITVFDDIETMDKDVQKYMEDLRNDVIKNGRDQSAKGKDIYCICTNHQLSDYKKTRDLLNECTSITIFPKSGSTYGIQRVLKTYFGMSKDQIYKVLNLPTRWVSLYSTFPQYVLYEKGAYIISNSEL